MNKVCLTVAATFFALPAMAQTPIQVPEMGAGAAVAAIALLAGAAAIIRERKKRK